MEVTCLSNPNTSVLPNKTMAKISALPGEPGNQWNSNKKMLMSIKSIDKWKKINIKFLSGA